jgi:S-methylmethionine-dependent homocysteine/selenocysteine methylase
MGRRAELPHLSGRAFVTDGGMETTLVFRHGLELPCFAAFHLLRDDAGTETLRSYFDPYLAIAREHDVGLVLDAPTWRASGDWGRQLGYGADALGEANRHAVELVEDVRSAAERDGTEVVICGAVGPRGDAYRPGEAMTVAEARAYHRPQVETLADTAADLVAALTMTSPAEAAGVALAAADAGIPSTISFTVETDGRLPSGHGLGEAVELVDRETDGAPAYFMINCAHPSHFAGALAEGGPWLERIGGIRANASRKSHADLDESSELDDGDPAALAAELVALRPLLEKLTVLGGCCGTDERHIAAICDAWLSSA